MLHVSQLQVVKANSSLKIIFDNRKKKGARYTIIGHELSEQEIRTFAPTDRAKHITNSSDCN